MYPRLIRDNTPDLLRKQGKIPVVHHADDDEYWDCLKEKLVSEVEHFLKEESNEALVEILEVIDAIKIQKNINESELVSLKARKVEEEGQFTEHTILDDVQDSPTPMK